MVRRLQHPLATRRCHFRSLAMSMTLTDLVAPNAIFRRSRLTTRSRQSRNWRRAPPNSPGKREGNSGDSAAAREARLDRRRQWRRDPARQAGEARQAVRLVRAAPQADRFRGARQPAGRSYFPAARAGSGRRRSSQGAGARRAAAARSGDRAPPARIERRRRALRRAGDAAGEYAASTIRSLPVQESAPARPKLSIRALSAR